MHLWKRGWPLLVVVLALGCGKSRAHWLEQTKSSDPVNRLHAIHVLQTEGERSRVVPVLVTALEDENSYVRRDAARVLGSFGSEAREAAPALRARLSDSEPSVRKAAALALQRIESGQRSPG